MHAKALEIADIFPGFSNDPRAIIVPDALVPGDYGAWLKRPPFYRGQQSTLGASTDALSSVTKLLQ
jgi:hypothetical protein